MWSVEFCKQIYCTGIDTILPFLKNPIHPLEKLSCSVTRDDMKRTMRLAQPVVPHWILTSQSSTYFLQESKPNVIGLKIRGKIEL